MLIVRIATLVAIIAPLAGACFFQAPDLLLGLPVVSLPMWMCLALLTHGSDRMIDMPESVSVWLWRHVNAWWTDLPEATS